MKTIPLMSAQRFRNPEIVAEKLAAEDFTVFYVPIPGFGNVIVDGHHALSAAILVGELPRLVLCVERCPAEDEDLEEWLAAHQRRAGDDWHRVL
jgi:hypothetical protein